MAGVSGERLPGVVRKASLLSAGAAVFGVLAVVAAVSAWRHVAGVQHLPVHALAVSGDKPPDVRGAVRSSVGYNLVAALVIGLATGLMAGVIRRPRWWVKASAWCLTAVAWLGLGLGLITGPEVPISTDPSESPTALGLVTSWYPTVNTLLTVGMLAALTTMAALLVGDSAANFYRPKTQAEDDPRWAAVFQERVEANAVGDAAAPPGAA